MQSSFLINKMEKSDVGTPVGGERKSRRLHSPLEEMDDVVCRLDLSVEERLPQTPAAAHEQNRPSAQSAEDMLAQIMANMVVKDDLNKMVADIAERTSAAIQDEIQPIKQELTELSENMSAIKSELVSNMEALESRIITAEANLADLRSVQISGVSRDVEERIAALESQIALLSTAKTNTNTTINAYATTAVIGGLGKFSSKTEAETWITNQMWYLSAPAAAEFYVKGEFSGILFAKFQNTADRDAAVSQMRGAKLWNNNSEIWAKPDMPLPDRVVNTVTFGLKRLLVSWGWDKFALWVDTDQNTLKLWDELIVKANIDDSALKLSFGPEWEVYFKDDKEVQTLLKSQSDKLQRGSAKGKGKGKRKGMASGAEE